MNGWHPTPALARALVTGAIGVGLAVLFGEPVLVVLVAPLLLVAALGLLHRPCVEAAAAHPARPRHPAPRARAPARGW